MTWLIISFVSWVLESPTGGVELGGVCGWNGGIPFFAILNWSVGGLARPPLSFLGLVWERALSSSSASSSRSADSRFCGSELHGP